MIVLTSVDKLQEAIAIEFVRCCKRQAAWLFSRFLLCLAFSFSSPANAMVDMPSGCDYRGIAQAITASQLQKAYSMSIECENALLSEQSKSFAESMLRGQYLATAQILTVQGKLDAAQDRISKTERLARTDLVPFDEIENSTRGFLLERSGSMDEAILFYLPIKQPYARARLAVIYLDQNQVTAATEAAGAALKDEPTNPTALVVLGNLLEKTNPSQALVQYRSAIASALTGNPSMMPLRYLELPKANAGIARLELKP